MQGIKTFTHVRFMIPVHNSNYYFLILRIDRKYFSHHFLLHVNKTSYMKSYLVLVGITSYMESYLVFTGITRDGSCRRSPDFRLHMRTPSHSLPLRSCKLIASDMSSATCHHIEGLDNVLLLLVKKWKTHMNEDLPNDDLPNKCGTSYKNKISNIQSFASTAVKDLKSSHFDPFYKEKSIELSFVAWSLSSICTMYYW